MSAEAFVTLATNDEYGIGAYVLGKSLRKTKTTRKLVIMVTSGVSSKCRESLKHSWDELVDIELYDSGESAKLKDLKRPELGVTYSKLRAWALIQFTKCVFLDADTLVMQNIDDLFQREEISASPDIGWPDCFNTGVFVFRPSMETYESLLEFANSHGTFDGGDQGLLNDYFNWWSTRDIKHHLPFTYNMVSNICYSYAPAYKRFGQDVKIVHFLGAVKPWRHYFNPETHQVTLLSSTCYSGTDSTFIQAWWDCYADGSLIKIEYQHEGADKFSLIGQSSHPGSPEHDSPYAFGKILDHIQHMIDSNDEIVDGKEDTVDV